MSEDEDFMSTRNYCIRFRDAIKKLGLKSISEITDTKFDNKNPIHLRMMNYILRVMLKSPIESERDWKLTGFQNSQAIFNYFHNDRSILLLLVILLLSEVQIDILLPDHDTKTTLEKLHQVANNLAENLKTVKVDEFFFYSLAVIQSMYRSQSHPLISKGTFPSLTLNKLQEYINEFSLNQIRNS